METIKITKLGGLLRTPALSGALCGFGGSRISLEVRSFDLPCFDGFGGDLRPWGARSERPTQAPVAAVAVREGYASAAAGAGTSQHNEYHQDQTIAAKAAAAAAVEVTTMRAYRGLEPWGKPT